MPTTKNLGIVRALHVGLTAPSNTKMMWYDDNPGIKILKYYDNATSTWKTFDGYGSFVEKTGDTMTGPLTLPTDPTLPLQAATKQYVDNLFANAAGTLTAVLANGNETLGHDIVMSAGDSIVWSGGVLSSMGSGSQSWTLPTESGTLTVGMGSPGRSVRWIGNYSQSTGAFFDNGNIAGIGSLDTSVALNLSILNGLTRGLNSYVDVPSGNPIAVAGVGVANSGSTSHGVLGQASGATSQNIGVQGTALGTPSAAEGRGVSGSAGAALFNVGVYGQGYGNGTEIGVLGAVGYALSTDQRTIGLLGAVSEGYIYDAKTNLLNARNIKAAVVGHYYNPRIASVAGPRYGGYFFNLCGNVADSTASNYGIYAEVQSGYNNYAVYAKVSMGNNAGEQIAGKFEVVSGTFKHALQLIDGSESVAGGKFLKDTGSGKARWTTITATDIAGIISGSGENNRITLWNGTNTITSSPVFTYNTAFGSIITETSETKTSIGGYNAGIKTNAWTDFGLASYYSASPNVYSRLLLTRGRGTFAAPTGALNGDILSDITTKGHGGNESFIIRVTAREDLTSTAAGASVDFRHAAVGQSSAFVASTLRMQFTANGRVRFHDIYTIPNTQGSAGQALLNDGSGNLYWGNVVSSSAVTGSGTVDYVARWTSASALGIGIIQDNGSNVGINNAPVSNYIFNVGNSTLRSTALIGNTFANTLSSQTSIALAAYSVGSNTGVNASNIGIEALAFGSTYSNIGIHSTANTAATVNVGGWFTATAGTANYAVRLDDGTQGSGKFLKAVDGFGNANWATINDYTADAAPSSDDYLMTFDVSTGVHKKVLLSSILALGGGPSSGVVDGSGQANYVARWSDIDTLSYGVIQDNGVKLAFGNAAFSTNYFLNSITNTFRVGARFKVEILSSMVSTTGLIGQAIGETIGDFNMGVSGIAAGSDTLNIGTQGVASYVSAIATNIGGEFFAEGGLENYPLRLVAANNDALGKVLYAYTADGKADWKTLTAADIAGGVDGAGTANYIPRWTDFNSLANGAFRDDGTRIGLGIAPSSDSKLSIYTDDFTQYGLSVTINTPTPYPVYGAYISATNGADAAVGLVITVSGYTEQYAVRLIDGRQGTGKFLRSYDNNGNAVWGTINDYTADATPDLANDYVLTWDASTSSHKKVLLNKLSSVGAISGSGTVNQAAKWTTTSTLGSSLFGDDGTQAWIGSNGSMPNNVRFLVWSSAQTLTMDVYNDRPDGTAIRGFASGTGRAVGVVGWANFSASEAVGVQGTATSNTGTIAIGGDFTAYSDGTNYSVRLNDGTQGVGKFLQCVTADGKANWAQISTGDILNLSVIYAAKQSPEFVGQISVSTVTNGSPTSNAWVYNCNNGMSQIVDLQAATASTAITFSNAREGNTYTLIVVQGSGLYNATFPTGWWLNDTAPFNFSTLSNDERVLVTATYLNSQWYFSAKKLISA